MDTKTAEEIGAFFDRSADGYEKMHLDAVNRGMEGKKGISALLPEGAVEILDLGAGTGLELEELFRVHPDVHVTAMDISGAMLEKLRERLPGKNIDTIVQDYFQADFGSEKYDAIITSMSLHHWLPEEKETLYAHIWEALRPGGTYIENDYLLNEGKPEENDAKSKALLAERLRLDKENPEIQHVHLDIPLTVPAEMGILEGAGFVDVKEAWHAKNNVTLTAKRPK